MKAMFEKLFCRHKWKTHAKEKYEWKQIEIVEETKYWPTPIQQVIEYSNIEEVLICESCGKIHQIEY
jgi:hypothetical protein